jgi:hypothetical protein
VSSITTQSESARFRACGSVEHSQSCAFQFKFDGDWHPYLHIGDYSIYLITCVLTMQSCLFFIYSNTGVVAQYRCASKLPQHYQWTVIPPPSLKTHEGCDIILQDSCTRQISTTDTGSAIDADCSASTDVSTTDEGQETACEYENDIRRDEACVTTIKSLVLLDSPTKNGKDAVVSRVDWDR